MWAITKALVSSLCHHSLPGLYVLTPYSSSSPNPSPVVQETTTAISHILKSQNLGPDLGLVGVSSSCLKGETNHSQGVSKHRACLW